MLVFQENLCCFVQTVHHFSYLLHNKNVPSDAESCEEQDRRVMGVLFPGYSQKHKKLTFRPKLPRMV